MLFCTRPRRVFDAFCCLLLLVSLSWLADSGIMCCMMGGPFENDRYMDSDRDRFEGDVASNSDASTAVKGGVGMM